MDIWCILKYIQNYTHITTYSFDSIYTCVSRCLISYFTQFTGVVIETILWPTWYCLITDNLIKILPGNNVILHKPNISTKCKNSGYDVKSSCKGCRLLRYDPEQKCSECLKPGYNPNKNCGECVPGYNSEKECGECLFGYDPASYCIDCMNGHWDGEFVLYNNPGPIQFDITFDGPLCTQISGW